MPKSVKNQQILTNCFSCKKNFRQKDISVVSENNVKTIFHVTCRHCQTSALITLQTGTEGAMGASLVTDLSRDEIKEKLFGPTITADDVLDIKESLDSCQL